MDVIVEGLLTHYEKYNFGENTLLILHGWGQSSSHWENLVSLLPKSIQTVAIDLPAFGQSESLPETPDVPGVPEYSAQIKAFIEKLKLKNVFLLGHSFGGQIAVDFSIRYPKLIKHLILVSPACVRSTTPTLKSKIASAVKPLMIAFPKPVKDFIYRKTASPNYYRSNAIQKKILSKILRQDYSSELKNVKVPTSIVWGGGDTEIPYMGKFLAEQIPNSQLYVSYTADHSPHLSAPQKFADILSEIFQKNV